MNDKDAHIQKILAELGLKEEPELSPAQEEILKLALDPVEQELENMIKVLVKED